MRIQKYLSEQNIASRRKSEEYILQGLVKVNGQVVQNLGFQFDPKADLIELDPQILAQNLQHTYLAFYKPSGIFTNCPEAGKKEIRDLLPPQYSHLSAIGRLDKESEGLILLSDDGIFAKSILSTKRPHTRAYKVWIDRELTESMQSALESGVSILGTKTQPVTIELISPRFFIMTMNEGKNRQIRRMLYSVGCKVIGLKRIAFGKVLLGPLNPGEFRSLTPEEVASFGKTLW